MNLPGLEEAPLHNYDLTAAFWAAMAHLEGATADEVVRSVTGQLVGELDACFWWPVLRPSTKLRS